MRAFHVDSFTDRPFRGNPAGVVLLDQPRTGDWMQSLAAEFNLPETAFLSAHGDGAYDLRWFSPSVEVELCGHATLASAHVLWTADGAPERLRFATRSGELTAERSEAGIVLDFPADPPRPADAATAERVAAAIGVPVREVGRARDKLLALVADEDTVRAVTPDIAAVQALDATGVIVTAEADTRTPGLPDGTPSADFVSRFFAPQLGIDEDPVTGAAHCVLAPFWVDRLGRAPLVGAQLSARGGSMTVEPVGGRVRLTGKAVTVLRGEID